MVRSSRYQISSYSVEEMKSFELQKQNRNREKSVEMSLDDMDVDNSDRGILRTTDDSKETNDVEDSKNDDNSMNDILNEVTNKLSLRGKNSPVEAKPAKKAAKKPTKKRGKSKKQCGRKKKADKLGGKSAAQRIDSSKSPTSEDSGDIQHTYVALTDIHTNLGELIQKQSKNSKKDTQKAKRGRTKSRKRT